MDKSEALENLLSKRAHNRLVAARVLARTANSADRERIVSALRSESVSWIRRSLSTALRRIEGEELLVAITEPDPKAVQDGAEQGQLFAEAVEEATSTLVHELEPMIGILDLEAGREIPNFEGSKTKASIDRLAAMVEAIGTLRRAAKPKSRQEFNVADLVDEIIREETRRNEVTVNVDGMRPQLVNSDRTLMAMIISNGLRNAIEATLAIQTERRIPVVISWGETREQFWIAINDSGIGIIGNSENAFKIGRTTKLSHLGMGLPTARQAANALGGDVNLVSSEGRGTRFELRVPR